MARGLIFVNESSATLWMWSNAESSEKTESVLKIEDGGKLVGENIHFDVDVKAYMEVADGLRPATSPIGRGVVGGESFTLWVRSDKDTKELVDIHQLTVAPSIQKNGLLNRVK